MKNSPIIIEKCLTWVVNCINQKNPFIKFFSQKKWSLNNYIYFFVEMILNFQKEINVIIYIIEIVLKVNSDNFILRKSQ
jgi:hypothetical protein